MTDPGSGRTSQLESEEAFDAMKALLRRHNATPLAFKLIRKIREIENKTIIEWGGWNLWELLVLIRWGFEHGGSDVLVLPDPTDDDVVNLMNSVKKLATVADGWFIDNPTKAGLDQWFRTASHEQMRLQHQLDYYDLSRQWALCNLMGPADALRQRFSERFGLRPEEFLCFAVMLYAIFLMNTSREAITRAQILENYIGEPQLADRFLSLVSLDRDGVQRFLRHRPGHTPKSPGLQVREPSPLARYPFLQANGMYLLYSLRLLGRAIESLFFEIMREDGTAGSRQAFSDLLEGYVDDALGRYYDKYYREGDLRGLFRNQTDFLVPFEDCTVLIEVKAVDLKPFAKVYQKEDTLSKALESNVIKGIVQGISIANELQSGRHGLAVPGASEIFLLVITFEDLYLGQVDRAWDAYIRDMVEPALAQAGFSSAFLPPHRMAVLSIREFDRLMSVLASSEISLPEILRKVAASTLNARWAEGKHMFSQHLEEYPSNQVPRHLLGKYDELREETSHLYR